MNNKNLRNYTKQSRGLGDTIQKFTSITGLQKLTQLAVGKKGCGCNKRKEALNKAFPYKNK